MAFRTRFGLILGIAVLLALSGSLTARQQPPQRLRPARPDFDVRTQRGPAIGSPRARAEMRRTAAARNRRGSRLNPHTGTVGVLERPGWTAARGAAAALRSQLTQAIDRLGLDDGDLESLRVLRDYVSRLTGLRHVTFAQSFDGIPVFGGTVTVHIDSAGEIVRVTSTAARGEGRKQNRRLEATDAATIASSDVNPEGAPFLRDVTASLVWFAMDGGLQLAWHVELEPEGLPQFYDVLVDAETGELLLRRNRVLDGNGSGRVVQSTATQALDPRRPDQMPVGTAACPPPLNHVVRDLVVPFRDPATVLGDTGRLSGNNVHVYRRNTQTESALGTFDGSRWLFDFPFNSAGSAETALFFALNFAHDFFYDLGFDEAAGNFQVDNFGRGGLGGDPIKGVARAAGRNNATFLPRSEGTSPVISMFLWDGSNCWSEDVDGDGTFDIDGDFDTDIVLHEFHHGVSHRLNTAFNGAEADAIGEGGSDFFAYSINGDTTLAEYSRPGGLRGVNGKTYNDWTCQSGFFCEPHDNGEIWANVLWDLRQRFRLDLVRGSEAAAINEVHQIYVDGLKLSPPSPTMLDLRDAMMEADAIRNPGTPQVPHFCALWETFAWRGMGLNASDTAANGFNQVIANFAVPPGCNAPPSPPSVILAVTSATATEAGPTSGMFTITRTEVSEAALIVNVKTSGTAVAGSDYVTIPATVTIPPGAASVDVPLLPIDDTNLEGNETAVLTLRSGSGYIIAGTPSGTVTIVSDDVAPDLTVTALTLPMMAGAGLTMTVTDTTRNQGTGPIGASTTSYYLSVNPTLDASDVFVGSRDVPALTPAASDVTSTVLTVPPDTATGTLWLIAKADGPNAFSEPNEVNNTRYSTIRIGPDLVVATLTVPAVAGPGTAINITETTTNTGAGSADASSTRYFLSANLAFDATDVPLGSRAVGALAPGASAAAVTTVTIPTDAGIGTFYVIALADNGNAVPEHNETNNQRLTTVRLGPDLYMALSGSPARAASGATITVTDTTKNNGGGGAAASTTAFYFSSNMTLEPGETRLGSRLVGPLDAGASSSGSTMVVLPAVTAGTYYVLANADDAAGVAETQETNNLRYTSILIGPDLVSSATAPATASVGGTITITDTIRNYGADTAGPSTTRFYLSLNSTLDAADIPIESERSVPAIVVNGANTGSTNVTLPAGLTGKYYLLVVADGLSAVPESNELNNMMPRVITINP